MPYNGSGTFALAEAPFVPATVISSSAVNSDLSDIATNGLSNAVTKDGQTTITGPFKGANGSVGAPMYSFASDTNTGMYRIGADNVGISAGGVKILDIGAGGLTALYLVQPAGTALLPTYTFTGDLNSGIYSIGADNIGVAVAGAKVLDISAAGLNVIGSVSSNGAAFSPTAQAAGMVNGTIVESHTGNAVTFAIKTLAGADPSATDIVYFVFRNVTPGTGNYVVLQVTAALSLTVSSGSTLGTASSNVPFKLWLVAFNDASTVRLGVINTVLGGASPTSIYPLGQFQVATSTAEGGAGGADSAQVFYTGTAVSAKAYSILGYASYETGVTTAGSWASTPTRLQLFGDGVPLPGAVVQTIAPQFGTLTVVTFTTLLATNITATITPTSTVNMIRYSATSTAANSTDGNTCVMQMYRGATPIGNISKSASGTGSAGKVSTIAMGPGYDAPKSVSAQIYQVYGVQGGGGTGSVPGVNTDSATLILEEIMT